MRIYLGKKATRKSFKYIFYKSILLSREKSGKITYVPNRILVECTTKSTQRM